jgi:hypothetical protein
MSNTEKRFIATNFNGKLATDHFIHIDLAPADRIPESRLNATTIELCTRDGSHPPVLVKIVDLARVKFRDVYNLAKCLTWCSHGMDATTLATRLATQHKNVTADSECAIFFYQKIKTTTND